MKAIKLLGEYTNLVRKFAVVEYLVRHEDGEPSVKIIVAERPEEVLYRILPTAGGEGRGRRTKQRVVRYNVAVFQTRNPQRDAVLLRRGEGWVFLNYNTILKRRGGGVKRVIAATSASTAAPWTPTGPQTSFRHVFSYGGSADSPRRTSVLQLKAPPFRAGRRSGSARLRQTAQKGRL